MFYIKKSLFYKDSFLLEKLARLASSYHLRFAVSILHIHPVCFRIIFQTEWI